MNVWDAMCPVERANADIMRSKLLALTEDTGKEYSYYYKIHPGSLGQILFFVCEELGIEKDITNYNTW